MQTEADTMAVTTAVSSLFMRAILIIQIFIRNLSFIGTNLFSRCWSRESRVNANVAEFALLSLPSSRLTSEKSE